MLNQKYLFIFFLLFNVYAPINTWAQTIKTNELGEKVVVFPDGSWKYYEAGDEKKYKINTPKGDKNKKNNKVKQPPKTEAEKKRDALQTKREEQQAKQQAIKLAEQATIEEQRAKQAEREAIYARVLAEDELNDAYNSDKLIDPKQLEDLEQKVDAAKAAEAAAKKYKKQAAKNAKKMAALIDVSKKKRDKAMAKMEKARQKEANAIAKTQPSEKTIDGTVVQFEPARDLMLEPPPYNCLVANRTTDEFTGKSKTDLAAEPLISYTDEKLRPYLKEREYLRCEAYLSAVSNGTILLNCVFEIASKTAPGPEEYGMLEKGSTFSIILLNKEMIQLKNIQTDLGKVDAVKGITTYEAKYLLDDEKRLRTSEIDQIRVDWSTGYEVYDVYNVDFFMNQLLCLDGKAK
ncbi:MAG: hypothetical protein KA974_07685 [Saprospiraceae bacterium]|nr:hypothetical protein [Saprospiraceae bacterium]MBP7680110.1 hypothetical protein [Saprospiraceae bacterium]